MGSNKGKLKIKSLFSLLNMNLSIPIYQRPYEWSRAEVLVLLDDIYKEYNKNKEINLGVIILFKDDQEFEIVDGQQRMITLSLLCKVLEIEPEFNFFNTEIECSPSVESKLISNNYEIKSFINRLKKNAKFDIDRFKKYIKHKIQFFVITTKDEDETFQLFDGRNSKFKQLDPIDLLKAYHLGVITDNNDKKMALGIWNKYIHQESELVPGKNKIQFLFDDVLFNIYNWALNKDRKDFTKDDIYLYKGYTDDKKYKYVKYYKTKDDNLFLINKPFRSGISFFKMIDKLISEYDKIVSIKNKYNLCKKVESDTGVDYPYQEFNYPYKFINIVYYNALFMFKNKYGNISDFEEDIIIEYLYKWVLIHRINYDQVSYKSINKYILDNDNFFFECSNSLTVDELYKLNYPKINRKPSEEKNDTKLSKTRGLLWEKLK